MVSEFIEDGFQPDFQVMASKNNGHRVKTEREYFDSPVAYAKQGFLFSPVHDKPIKLETDPNSVYNTLKKDGSVGSLGNLSRMSRKSIF